MGRYLRTYEKYTALFNIKINTGTFAEPGYSMRNSNKCEKSRKKLMQKFERPSNNCGVTLFLWQTPPKWAMQSYSFDSIPIQCLNEMDFFNYKRRVNIFFTI